MHFTLHDTVTETATGFNILAILQENATNQASESRYVQFDFMVPTRRTLFLQQLFVCSLNMEKQNMQREYACQVFLRTCSVHSIADMLYHSIP